MSLLALLSLRGTVQTIGPGAVDRYNQLTETVTVTTTDVPYRLEQTESTEITVGESTVVSDWKLFLMPTVTISHLSRFIDVDGRTFEVVGPPNKLVTPRGPHHIEARLRYVA